MAEPSLKKQIMSGMVWKFAERFIAQGVSFIVSLVLARILMPDDYGVVSIINVFITVALEELPERTDYSLRLQIEVMFMDERTCRLRFKDVGFGEFYPASDFLVEKELHLGGINGQFNSLS